MSFSIRKRAAYAAPYASNLFVEEQCVIYAFNFLLRRVASHMCHFFSLTHMRRIS
ncbi:MAG TPA: hypothetical protein PLI57_02090 [Spirochaetota bacterium]|nr:hypothetical protein [Spirochaetota bacterium]